MNLGGLGLNLLVALDALLSERSVTRAAQRVGLSQPGMSNAFGRLLDDPLLVRQGATLVPTARAETLIGPVHEALELIRSALDAQRSFDPANDRRSFRLSCSDYSVLMLIGPLVRALAADAPGSSSRSYRGSQMPRERCSTATSTS
jgi:LysR family nod box-dependent transcriptional activator